MMPTWIWRYYEACMSTLGSSECDEKKADEAKEY
jgi:hypothetical protein